MFYNQDSTIDTVIILQMKQSGLTVKIISPNHIYEMANTAGPGQSAGLGAVWSHGGEACDLKLEIPGSPPTTTT